MKRFLTILLWVLLLCPLAAKAPKSNKAVLKDLEKQRKTTLTQIQTTQRLLQETKKNESATLNKLTLLNKSIEERRNLIQGTTVEIHALDREIASLGHQKDSLQNRLQYIEADYARLVRVIYFNYNTQNWLLYLLSARSFNSMFQRAMYLRELMSWRKRQAAAITQLHKDISDNETAVRDNRRTKNEALVQQKREHASLKADEAQQSQTLAQLKQKEKDLSIQQQKQQKKANELNARIERVIAQEIARQQAEAKKKAEAERKKKEAEAKKKAEAAKKKTTTTTTTTTKTTATTGKTTSGSAAPTSSSKTSTASSEAVSSMTKEEQLLSGSFEANRGRMPWPVEKGVIVGSFGVQAHPTLQHVTINNKGIYIQSPSGSAARAIFEGVVTQRFAIPGSNNAVIVQHGTYRTVYANLTDIYVKVGDHVTPKQRLGRIYTDPENGNKTELYFQLWKDRTIINPAPWLAR